ncbi:hypothetical protein BB561_006885, partial [Smittium simulii]
MTKSQSKIYKCQSRFDNQFELEALPKAILLGLSVLLNSLCDFFSGKSNITAFNFPQKHLDRKNSLYRMNSCVSRNRFQPYTKKKVINNLNHHKNLLNTSDRLGRLHFDISSLSEVVYFVDGISTFCNTAKSSICDKKIISIYLVDSGVKRRAMINSAGNFLIIPEQGTIYIRTDFGKIAVRPKEICVIQRGIKFNVEFLKESKARYIIYIFEDYAPNYEPPDDVNPESNFGGGIYHKTYAKYKPCLVKFCVLDAVSFGHPGPSIFM